VLLPRNTEVCAPNAPVGLTPPVSRHIRLLQFAADDSGAEVLLGRTRVLTAISAELVPPFADRGNEGRVQYNVEFSPMASPAFESGRPGAPHTACVACHPRCQGRSQQPCSGALHHTLGTAL
jgi:hypothetical protein